MAVGAIPIVEWTPLSEILFKDHPVLILSTLENISKAALEEFLVTGSQKRFHRNHLWFDFWRVWLATRKREIRVQRRG